MGKPAQEFFPVEQVAWREVGPGVGERVLAVDPADPSVLTRVLRWDPGVDTSPAGPVTHDYVEEVLILRGSFVDLTLGQTFSAGDYTSRPPGMVHGPWLCADGCEMLEIRYRA